jgi:hypothetical protein
MIAVIDTGPLLVFAKLQHLHLLDQLFETILIPEQVYDEAVITGLQRGYPDAAHLQAFIAGHHWPTISPALIGSDLARERLGKGKVQAIAVAQARTLPLLIDDSDARRVAERLGIATFGSLGILAQAFRASHLTASELEELLTTIENRPDIWIHPVLCQRLRSYLLDS